MDDFVKGAAEFWDGMAQYEQDRKDEGDKIIHTHLIVREISRQLTGDDVMLDIGAGTGRFSLPAARECKKVIHLAVSAKMNELE